MKKKERILSFRDNMRKALGRGTLLPMISMLLAFVVIIPVFGGYAISMRTAQSASQMEAIIAETLHSYDALAEEMTDNTALLRTPISLTRRNEVMRLLYRVQTETGFGSKLYIFDKDLNQTGMEEEDPGTGIKRNAFLSFLKEQEEGAFCYVNAVGENRRLYIGRRLEGETDIAYLVLELNAKDFMKPLMKEQSHNLIVANDNFVFAADTTLFMDSVGRAYEWLREKNGFSFADEKFLYISKKTVGSYPLTVYGITDFTYAALVMLTVFLTGTIVTVILYMCSLAGMNRVLEKNAVDITHLNEAFEKVSAGSFKTRPALDSSLELQSISNHFANMMDSLEMQMKRNTELAELVSFIQVKQLTSQFQSHFLFNTLDNIRFMIQIDPEPAQQMVLALSELLRYSTGNQNEKVMVEEDLRYTERYLEIVKSRYHDGFTYEMQTENSVKEALIPKLLLQPIIENAIKYGFESKDHLHIKIKAEQQGAVLVFKCQDDGTGIAPDLLDRIREYMTHEENKTSHLGLYNVHRRIRLMYGEGYGLTIENHDGILVTLSLPVEREEDGDA